MKTVLTITMLICMAIVFQVISAAEGFSEPGNELLSPTRQDRSAKGGGKGANKNRGGNGGGGGNGCRYIKGSWGECDQNTNMRSRTLTLKRVDQAECEQTKIETRKCKKPCRYTRGQWTVCDGSVHMKERIDQLKSGSDPSCEATKRTVKKCKGKSDRKQHHGRQSN